MIRRLLVANRGEIARRVFATCRLVGIETVAVYSDADADSPHVAAADYAVHLPGSSPGATYLRGDLIIAAARRAGADAIHPGYGFLAENAEFAEAVADSGLTWVGPPAKAIALMGSKIEAKALLTEAGVPMLPTYLEPEQVTEFPVLVKASAGGGGRGMRVVRDAESLPEAVASARREAAAAFGDGTVFCERYVERARHIEVQVLADSHGNIITFGERECSIQRRHQKIVEETPSPGVTPALRERMLAAAVRAGETVGYRGAGSVEFLVDPARHEFSFLEMSTRLPSGHVVTEMVTGIDLVEQQFRIAAGGPVSFTDATPRGHAIAFRVHAEDPREFRPGSGEIKVWEEPAGDGIRIDTGYAEGNTVTPHYHPLLAKLCVHGDDRGHALARARAALGAFRIEGPPTNLSFLRELLDVPGFADGTYDTGIVGRMRGGRAS